MERENTEFSGHRFFQLQVEDAQALIPRDEVIDDVAVVDFTVRTAKIEVHFLQANKAFDGAEVIIELLGCLLARAQLDDVRGILQECPPCSHCAAVESFSLWFAKRAAFQLAGSLT